MIKDIVLVGVGGQGVVLAANLLAAGFLHVGYPVKQSEIHGMAQRGGSVVTFVRRGRTEDDEVSSPVIEAGSADALLAFEKLEALRYVHYLKPGGLLIYSEQEIVPTSVSALGAPYPEDIDAELAKRAINLVRIDADAIGRQCGNPRTGNVAMVGALAAHLGLERDLWDRIVETTVPRALKENLAAFECGYEAARTAKTAQTS